MKVFFTMLILAVATFSTVQVNAVNQVIVKKIAQTAYYNAEKTVSSEYQRAEREELGRLGIGGGCGAANRFLYNHIHLFAEHFVDLLIDSTRNMSQEEVAAFWVEIEQEVNRSRTRGTTTNHSGYLNYRKAIAERAYPMVNYMKTITELYNCLEH